MSINQFIATAVAEKMSALLTLDFLEERAQRGSRSHFKSVLRRVPDARLTRDTSGGTGARGQEPDSGRKSGARPPFPTSDP